MTLCGVWWTIKYQNEQRIIELKKHDDERRENLAIQYKPILQLSRQLDSELGMYYRDLTFSYQYTTEIGVSPEYIEINSKKEADVKFYFAMKNIGRGCMTNAYIKKLTIQNQDIFDNHINDWITNTNFGDLVPNEEIAFILHFPGLLRFKNEYLNSPEDIRTTVNVVCEYTDEFNVHQYQFDLYLNIRLDINKTELQSGVEGVSIVAPTYYLEQAMPVLTQIK